MQVNQKIVIMLLFLSFSSLVGCSTTETDKLPKVKGAWELVNQKEFIPENTKKYIEGVDIDVFNKTKNQVTTTEKAKNTGLKNAEIQEKK